MEQRSNKDLFVTLSVLLAIVFIVTGVLLTNNKKTVATGEVTTTLNPTSSADMKTLAPTTDTSTPSTRTIQTTNVSDFKDGTYNATADYATPENNEDIKLSITIKDGFVTDTSATVSARSRESKEYSTRFVQDYKSYVIGKPIASIKLSRVSGSSLTTEGFNDALAQIEYQAKA